MTDATGTKAAVKVGQEWQDCDYRIRGDSPRIGQVVAVDDTHATIEWWDTGITRRVLISRMKPTANGYRLVKDAVYGGLTFDEGGDPADDENPPTASGSKRPHDD